MNIKEIEIRTGLERANIYFYEKEGLVTPARLQNGYRDYSEEDLKILMKIKLLRSLHISLEDIRALKDGNISLSTAMEQQILELEKEEEKATYARMLCENIRNDEISFTKLDAEKYLNGVPRSPKPEENPYFSMPLEVFPQTLFPWKRFFARVCDLLLYKIVVVIFFNLTFGVSIINPKVLESWLIFFAELLLWFVVEPCCLHLFGATPGKALWGLSIKNTNGKNLSFRDSWRRTCWVFLRGLGLHIPIYRCYRLYQCYQRCGDHRLQDWEVDIPIQYTCREGLGRNRIDQAKKILSNRKIVVTFVCLLLTIFFAYVFYPRPIANLIKNDITSITIVTNDFVFDAGTSHINQEGYTLEDKEDIERFLNLLDNHSYHHTLEKYFSPITELIFSDQWEHGYHNMEGYPDVISIWFHLDSSDSSSNSCVLSTWGDGYLNFEDFQNDEEHYRIGYFGKEKSKDFFRDIIHALREENQIF